jgi:dTDP-glucose 4,6-dehydratase
MRTLLVTGGMGFIGSNFIIYWMNLYPNDKIVNLDALTYAGNPNNLKDVAMNKNYHFVHGNIGDKGLLDQIFSQGVNITVHFAAESHVDRSIASPSEFIRTNVLGTHELLYYARKHGVDKFINVSTDEVYGTLGSQGFFTEQSPLLPNSPYSASKAGGDLIARAYYETYDFPVIVTRCSNNYGPRQFPEKLIPTVIVRALNDKAIPIYGDGLYIRDWLHVEDHCAALEKVITSGVRGEVYNIGGQNEHTNLELVELILRLLNKPSSLIQFVQDRMGHDRRYAIDASKISDKLGFKPAYSFEQGISETVCWYEEHSTWWEDVIKKEGKWHK